MEWIKASERLPDTSGKYFCKTPEGNGTFFFSKETVCFPFRKDIIEWLDESPSNDEDEWVDLQEQVRKHIKEQLFDWDEALTGEEMIYLENLLLTFNPLCPVGSIGFEEQKKHIERLTRKLSDKESNTMEDDSRENVASKAT